MIDRDRLISAVESRVGNCLIFNQLDSTHLFARRLMEQLDEEDIPVSPTLVLAETQRTGLGRAERTWSSRPGGLYVNLVWAMTDPSSIANLPVLAASAVHLGVTAVGINNARIKWPNDILVDGKKLGGILIHARHGARLLATVGFGINVTETPDLTGLPCLPAISMNDILGPGDVSDRSIIVIKTFLDHFTDSLQNPRPVIAYWKTHLIHTEGEPLSLQTSSGAFISGTYGESTTTDTC